MKLLMINPSLRLGSPTKFLPVGIGSVMTYLYNQGYDIDLFDIDINDHSDQTVEDYLAKNKYDIILTGSIVTHYKWMKWLTKTIKKHHPKTKIIVGNSVAGSIPEIFLKNSTADVAIIGEGEIGALETVKAIEQNKSLHEVEGIAFLDKNGKFVKTPKRKACDINSLPFVNWDLFDTEKYFEKSDHESALGFDIDKYSAPRVMPVTTARGCAFKCTFCHYVYWDDPYRHRSPENILQEIKINMEKYGANYFNFWDDLSFAGLHQAEKIADAILKSGLKFHWNAAVRVDLLGHPRNSYERRLEVAQKFKESGCLNLSFSLESGNQEILNMMNKKIKLEYFTEQAKLLKKVGITSCNSVVFGYPLETKETIQETFDMCYKAGIYPSIGYLLPLPYTGMYEYAKQHGFITDDDTYLDSITERQDLCLNMTQLEDQEILDCIKNGAKELNAKLKINLDESKLIKTGGYRKHTKLEDAPAQTEEEINLNYSQQLFDIDLGTGTEAKAKKKPNKKTP